MGACGVRVVVFLLLRLDLGASLGNESLFDKALGLVVASQSRCAGAQYDVVQARSHVGGFASGVHATMIALSSALAAGRVLVSETPSSCGGGKRSHGGGRGQDFDAACFFAARGPFRALSPCAAGAGRRPRKATASRFQLSPRTFEGGRDAARRSPSAFVAAAASDERLARAPTYFWASVLAAYVARPAECLETRVTLLRESLFGSSAMSGVLGVHARLSDKDREAYVHDWREYATAVVAIANEVDFGASRTGASLALQRERDRGSPTRMADLRKVAQRGEIT